MFLLIWCMTMMYLKINDKSSKSTEKQMMQQKIIQILCEFLGLQAILRISAVPVLHLVLKFSSFGQKFVNSIYLSYNLYLCFRCWSYEENATSTLEQKDQISGKKHVNITTFATFRSLFIHGFSLFIPDESSPKCFFFNACHLSDSLMA